MLDFPNSPTNGQVFGNYTWDGEKWGQSAGGAILPASNPPLVDAASAAIGSSTKYAREDHVHPVFARPLIYAAPFDAMAYSGLQINGGMDVSQELGGAGRLVPGYICDGWYFTNSSTAAIAVNQASNGINPGFPGYITNGVTTGQATPTGTQAASFFHPLEGYRMARLAWGTASAQPLTIGFWTCHHRTGLYSVAVRNSDDSRSYTTTYTHNAVDVWEYKTVTIPGDTTGTWLKDNGVGARIQFAFACGPTYTAPASNTWYGSLYIAAPGQINGVAATSDVFRLTGVTIHPGNEAPSAARSPFVMRPYDQELVTCRRYFWRRNFATNTSIGMLQAYSTTLAGGPLFTLSPEMRSAPSISVSSAVHFSAYTPGGGTVLPSSLPFLSTSDQVILNTATFASGLAAGGASLFSSSTPNAWIQMDARL